MYIGTCVFEGVNVSEGRGTTQPFELIGSPWINAAALEKRMVALDMPGLHFRRASFKPTFSKYQNELCHGVQLHITDREKADVFLGGLKLLETIRDMYPEKLEYLSWGESRIHSLDKLLGTDAFREGRLSADEIAQTYAPGVSAFSEAVKPFLLYR